MQLAAAPLSVPLLALLLCAAARGQHLEDRPLPASPCPDVFSYEGSTVDWDRWYGVVLVATDTPLTGLRLDVWLSRPALALRHNWDGNVTTIDHKRFTILNLYKRIEPGPPRSIRVVVKFDEKQDIPFLRAIELNGRRICSSITDSQPYDEHRRPTSRPQREDDELPLSHSSPSNSKYDFDRTTQRSTPADAYNDPYDSNEHEYKNAVSKRPPSNIADPVYERTTTHRPAYSDDKYSYDGGRSGEYHQAPRTPTRQEPSKPPAYNGESETYNKRPAYHTEPETYTKRPVYHAEPDTFTKRPEYHTEPGVFTKRPEYHAEPEAFTKRPEYHAEPETYTKHKMTPPPQYESPPASVSRRPSDYDQGPTPSPSHYKPSSGGGGKRQPDDPRVSDRGAPSRTGNPSGSSSASGYHKPATTSRPEDRKPVTPLLSSRRPLYDQEPVRRPAYEDQRRPEHEESAKFAGEQGSRLGGHPQRWSISSFKEQPIDVRIGTQRLGDDRGSADAHGDERGGESESPPRQPGYSNGYGNGNVPPGHGSALPPGLQKRVGGGGSGGPPGLGGNLPPGHGGPVPGHNKGNGNHNNNYDHNKNSYDGSNSGDGQASTEANRRQSSTLKPDRSPERPPPAPSGEDECGRTLSVTPLITHARNTSRGQWPWHTALYQVKGPDLKYICGGTLISPDFIVTAAHCVTRPTTGRAHDPDTIIAYLGKYHLHRWTHEEGVQQGKVAAIHVHPDYNTTNFRGDLALLELSTPLSYTQYVRPICLWSEDEPVALNNVVNKEGYVVGWGFDEDGELTEELRMATMPIVSEQTCLRSYPEFYSRFSNERTFCAGYRNGTSACNGDSGGGLVLPRMHDGTKVWFLRGLVSVSVSRDDRRMCNTEHYVVFTDLAKYGDWIGNYVR